MHQHHHNQHFNIAIVDDNILACMGLQKILQELLPMADIVVYESFDALKADENEEYIHYFISSRIYFEHTTYFRSKKGHSIVMVSGDLGIKGVATLNVCQNEVSLIKDLLKLQHHGHHGHNMPKELGNTNIVHETTLKGQQENILSTREIEVALLLCQGYINKEIANKLNISLSTVVTHRKNIMEKLDARSLADVVIFCVLNGIYDIKIP